jgi:cobalamin biosynthesis protein CobT
MPAPRDAQGFGFETALGKIARVLTGQYGVTVAFSPDGPRVEQDRIVIPDHGPGEALSADVLTGYLDLLVARAKHSALALFDAQPPGVVASLAQIIEDRRVCAQLVEQYPGARWFIGTLRAHSAARAQRQWSRLRWRERLLWRIERVLWHEAAPAREAGASLDATLAALDTLLDAAARSRSSAESMRLAGEIVARVRALAAGDAHNMMFTARGADALDTHGAPGDAEDTARADDASRAAADNDAAPAGAHDDVAGRVGMAHTLAAALAQAAEAAEAAEATEPPAADRADAAGPARAALSIPLATEFDVVSELTGSGDAAAWRALRTEARAHTAQLKARLERALSADERTRWQREQERGEIDRAALARLATSPGYRTPFRVTRIARGRDVAVTLLIDRSGSMAGRKIELARLCAAALADALTQLGFACEVLGYCSLESAPMRALYERQRAAGVDLRRYNRLVERLDLQVYKRFGSSDLSGLTAIDCGHENPDGEALAWAARRLADQPAGRRILMVFSDGYPATGDGDPRVLRSDLRERVAAIGQRGIELVGIGVLTDAVEAFYPHNVVVSRLAELPSTVFSVLGAMLLRR